MTQIEEKVLDSTFEFSAPVTPNSPATDRDRIHELHQNLKRFSE